MEAWEQNICLHFSASSVLLAFNLKYGLGFENTLKWEMFQFNFDLVKP